MADRAGVYVEDGREYDGHGKLDHTANEYVRDANHTNTVENIFSIFKRGVIGTYHHLSEAHLHRYTAEFDFRYNTGLISDAERADKALIGIASKRLTYRRSNKLAA